MAAALAAMRLTTSPFGSDLTRLHRCVTLRKLGSLFFASREPRVPNSGGRVEALFTSELLRR